MIKMDLIMAHMHRMLLLLVFLRDTFKCINHSFIYNIYA